MLAGMTSRQLAEWMAFAAVEPFGDARSDFRMAYLLSAIVNMFRGPNGQPVSPQDLIPLVGALAEEDREWQEARNADDAPPKHPNVILFEQMMGL